MNSLDYLKNKYKPYRYTINNNIMIVDSVSGKFAIKKVNKDLNTLYNYLDNRNFYYHPNIIYQNNNEIVYEYLDNDDSIPNEIKINDLIDIIGSLHNKTVYHKNIKLDDIKKIREDILSNTLYLENYYHSLFLLYLKKEYNNSYEYLFLRSYKLFISNLNYIKDNINKWYLLKENDLNIRVAILHNNLSLDHLIEYNDDKRLISFDNYVTDIPILDIINLYHKEYDKYDFNHLLEKYNYNFTLKDDEKILLNILLMMPINFNIDGSIFENTKSIKKVVDYLEKTSRLVGIHDFEKGNE